MNLLSLFSGCGGMDIGFEGDFLCLKKSINAALHPDWIEDTQGDWVRVQPTIFRPQLPFHRTQSGKSRFFAVKRRRLRDS